MNDSVQNSPREEASRGTSTRGCALLVAVVVVGAVLRLGGLGAESLWWDEVLTTYSAREPLSRVIGAVRGHENAPPLYFIVANVWAKAFGMSDVAMRMPSALLGVASIVVIYRLAAEMFDRPIGLTAAALLAVSPIHIAYSQEARQYSLMVFLLIVCTWAFVRMMRNGSGASQIAYVVTAAAALLTHTFAAFTLVGLNAFWLVRLARRRETGVTLRRWIMLNAAVVLLFGPWLPATMEVARMGLPWLTKSTPFHEALAGYMGLIAGLPMIGLGGFAIGMGLRRRDDRVLLLVLLALLPVLGPIAHGAFTTRYGIASLTGLLILVAYGAASIGRWACIAIVVIAAANWVIKSSLGHARYPNYTQKIDVKSAARHVFKHPQPGEVVVAGSRGIWHVLEHYTRGGKVALFEDISKTDAERLWFVAPAEAAAPPPGYEVVASRVFDGVVVMNLHRVPTEPATTRGVPSTYPAN